MSDIREQIRLDTNVAMKARDKLRVSTLRMLTAAFQTVLLAKSRAQKDLDKGLSDQECLKVLVTAAKRRGEAAEAFRKGGKEQMALQEEAERVIIREYLPKQFTEEEVLELATQALSEIKPSSQKEMGKVMGKIMPQLKGKFDGKKAGQIVRDAFKAYLA